MSVFSSSRSLLAKHGLQACWDNPPIHARCTKTEWGEICYTAVESTEDSLRSDRMLPLFSMVFYRHVKK